MRFEHGMSGVSVVQVGRCGLDASDSVASCCEHGNEPSCTIKGG